MGAQGRVGRTTWRNWFPQRVSARHQIRARIKRDAKRALHRSERRAGARMVLQQLKEWWNA